MSTVLVSEERELKGAHRTQNLIYYLLSALQGAEYQYAPIEKLALVVVVVVRRLRPVFQAHVITIPMGYLMLQVLCKLDISRRLTKWVMELNE